MTDEEKKAIEKLKNYIKEPYSLKIDERTGFARVNTKFHLPRETDIQIILNLIEKQDKMIDLMAKYIDDYSIKDEFCTKKNCYADDYINGHCEKCLNCIKEHFRKKVKNNER